MMIVIIMSLIDHYDKYIALKSKYEQLKNLMIGGDGEEEKVPETPPRPRGADPDTRPTTLSRPSHPTGEQPSYSSTNITGSKPLVLTDERSTVTYNLGNTLWRGNLTDGHSLRDNMIAWVAINRKDALIYGYPLKLRVDREFKILNVESIEARTSLRAILEERGVESELVAFDKAFPIKPDGKLGRMSMFDIDTIFIDALYEYWPTEWLDQGYLGFGAGRLFISEGDTKGHHSEMALFFKEDHISGSYLTGIGIDKEGITKEMEEEYAMKRISLEDKRKRLESRIKFFMDDTDKEELSSVARSLF